MPGTAAVPIPAAVMRHRESVRRLSLGARTSQLLVGKTLTPTQLDDEAYKLTSADTTPPTVKSTGADPCEDRSTQRYERPMQLVTKKVHGSHPLVACRLHKALMHMEAMRYVPHVGLHWVAEIVEEISKPPKYTPDAVLGILEEFEMGLQQWHYGVHRNQTATS